MTGILSSVVEFHEHQVEIARRILEDPIQRYLLADEVGLGKTIEAGFVIRQYLLDKPDGHILILAPPLLRRQWVAELREKFLIDDFVGATVSVLSHEEPASWERHANAELVVVDEAHHLAAGFDDQEASARERYAALARLARKAPRLLLLSATPILNNERSFLAMLHLLDPDVYSLNDLEAFRSRIRNRQPLSKIFLTLREDTRPFLLHNKINELRRLFPSDNRLNQLLDALDYQLTLTDASTGIQGAIRAIRVHIGETYRLHRRLLRTRRTAELEKTFRLRGRQSPKRLFIQDERVSCLNEWL